MRNISRWHWLNNNYGQQNDISLNAGIRLKPSCIPPVNRVQRSDQRYCSKNHELWFTIATDRTSCSNISPRNIPLRWHSEHKAEIKVCSENPSYGRLKCSLACFACCQELCLHGSMVEANVLDTQSNSLQLNGESAFTCHLVSVVSACAALALHLALWRIDKLTWRYDELTNWLGVMTNWQTDLALWRTDKLTWHYEELTNWLGVMKNWQTDLALWRIDKLTWNYDELTWRYDELTNWLGIMTNWLGLMSELTNFNWQTDLALWWIDKLTWRYDELTNWLGDMRNWQTDLALWWIDKLTWRYEELTNWLGVMTNWHWLFVMTRNWQADLALKWTDKLIWCFEKLTNCGLGVMRNRQMTFFSCMEQISAWFDSLGQISEIQTSSGLLR